MATCWGARPGPATELKGNEASDAALEPKGLPVAPAAQWAHDPNLIPKPAPGSFGLGILVSHWGPTLPCQPLSGHQMSATRTRGRLSRLAAEVAGLAAQQPPGPELARLVLRVTTGTLVS